MIFSIYFSKLKWLQKSFLLRFLSDYLFMLLYSLIIYEIVNFSFFALYSLLLLSFFLYLKSVPIYVIVHTNVVPATVICNLLLTQNDVMM